MLKPGPVISLVLSVVCLVSARCPYGLTESALCEGPHCQDCVQPWTLLLGGSYNSDLHIQWRRDIEIWTEEGPLQGLELPPFPHSLDHPFAWWSSSLRAVLVCGGKNWDDDVSSSLCWRYDHCQGTWRHELDLPIGLHGGASIKTVSGHRETFWLVGGGNTTAFDYVFKLNLVDSRWIVTEELRLHEARYGHCAALVNEDSIVVIGGHSDGIVDSVEIINISNNTVELSADLTTPTRRWGLSCTAQGSEVLVMGGMDSFFLPHNNLDILDMETRTWSRGPSLPWAESGASLTVMAEGPTLFSGMGLGGFNRRVASLLSSGKWRVWSGRLDRARVSSVGVAVPSDIFQVCSQESHIVNL